MCLKNITIMKTCVYVVIVHAISTIQCASVTVGATASTAQGNDTQQVLELQKQKAQVYNQLNGAVDDAVKTLQKSNNSFAKEGITNLLELLVLMHNFSDAELAARNCSEETAPHHTIDSNTTNSNTTNFEARRSFNRKGKSASGFDHIKQAILQMGFIKNSVDLNKVKDEKLRNLLAFQAKLDKWLKLREIEKQKIKLERIKSAGHHVEKVTETCPNFGDKKGKGKKGKSEMYPCCRKCCKSSYLGCL